MGRESTLKVGTVTLLGAGASVEAGYPAAANLLDTFKVAVEEVSLHEIERRVKNMKERPELEKKAAEPPPGTLAIILPEFRNLSMK